jgi:hypothetical protein
MDEEVIPCGYFECDVHIVRPGKSQCSHENTSVCGMNYYNFPSNMDKTIISKMDMKTFREIKDLEYQIQQLKDDLKEADFCIDYLQGKVLLRDNEIIALRNKIQDLQK